MSGALSILIGVVVLLGGLIFFHELGHYLIAKFYGVKVEVFSLGFGKKILSKRWGETEYCLSIFPLGGYVKLMGDDPYKEVPAEQVHRAFSTQALYKRFAIVAAGPMFNLILAYFLYVAVFWVGQPVADSVIGSVALNSDAWKAGFRSGDRIVEVLNTEISHWDQFEELLKPRAGEEVTVKVERGGQMLSLPVVLAKLPSKTIYGEDVMVGGIQGIGLSPLASVVGISDPKSPAALAGLRTGNWITQIDSQKVEKFDDLESVLSDPSLFGKSVKLTVKRGEIFDPKKMEETHLTLTLAALSGGQNQPYAVTRALGLYPSDVFVREVSKDSPAERGGLLKGDHILGIGDQQVHDFNTIVDLVQEKGKQGGSVVLNIQRNGENVTLDLKPEVTEIEDKITREKIKKYMIGFRPEAVPLAPEFTKVQVRNVGQLLKRSAAETYINTERMLISIGKLILGQISVKNLGGPVLIAQVAGKSLDAGIIPFLQVMAMISINLFLLNLFPIPILDGGHLLFFTIEAIQRKPVSIRTMEVANQLGLVFILLLVGLTLFNDITRAVL